jgi:hypothetical protein
VRIFVIKIETLKRINIVWDVANAHAFSNFAPKVEGGQSFMLDKGSPTEPHIPANWLIDKGGEYIQIGIIGDSELMMHPVHLTER